jgi:hypothetical protein
LARDGDGAKTARCRGTESCDVFSSMAVVATFYMFHNSLAAFQTFSIVVSRWVQAGTMIRLLHFSSFDVV